LANSNDGSSSSIKFSGTDDGSANAAIASAAAWWARDSDGRSPWRSSLLQPPEPLISVGVDNRESLRRSEEDADEDVRRRAIVREVVRRRNEHYRDAVEAVPGRLLTSWGCNYSLGSGEAADASGGFFDEYDLPPWELWVAYATPQADVRYPGPALIAWIPRALIEVVESGIAACPADCIAWFEA
jgi:hypothetical protein